MEGQLRKIVILICIISLLAVVGLGCFPSKPATTAATVSEKDAAQDASIASIKSSITSLDENKASKSSVNDVNDRISKINTASAPVDTYTKTEINAAIATAVNNAVANLKADQAWVIKSSSSGTGGSSGSSSDDEVIASNGELDVIEISNIGNEVYLEEGGSATWKLIVRNNDSVRHYFKLMADLAPEDGSTVSLIYADPKFTKMTSSYPAAGVFKTSTTDYNNIGDLSYTLYDSGSNYKIYINKDSEVTIYVTFTIHYAPSVAARLWTCDFSIKSYD